MQFNITLSGDEDPSQLRRVANAVLALAGVSPTQTIKIGDISMDLTPAQVSTMLADADRPDVGAEHSDLDVDPAVTPVSAVPLPPAPPAPLAAAAELFTTAPEAPAAGVPAPPTVAAPPAPTAPGSAVPPAPAAPSNPVNSAELDKAGLPWDARIHSGSREKIKDGTWRQRRNLPEGERERVEAELRALMALPANVVIGDAPTSAVPLPPAVPAAPATAPATITASPATPATVPVSASGGEAPNVPPAPPSSAPATAAIPTPPAPPASTAAAPSAPGTGGANPFAALMTKITSGVTGGRFTEAQVHAAMAEQGLQPSQMAHLAARHDLAELISARLDQFVAGGQ